MMKKILTLLLLLLCSVAGADEKSDKMLSALWGKVSAMENYQVRFTVGYSGGGPARMEEQTGYYLVAGNSYYMSVMSAEVYCDGKTRYEVDPVNMTVSISKVDPKDRTMLSNPTRAFDFLDHSYTSAYMGETKYAGAPCSRIELKAKDASQEAFETITVWVDSRTGLPSGVSYVIEGGQTIWITVKELAAVKTPDRAKMTFDRKKYKDYDFIDFR